MNELSLYTIVQEYIEEENRWNLANEAWKQKDTKTENKEIKMDFIFRQKNNLWKP